MKPITSKILVALFAITSSLNADELVEVSAVSEAPGPESREMTYTNDESDQIINVSKTSIIATEDVRSITIGEDPLVVIVDLTPDGKTKMMKGTADLAGKRLAVLVNGRVQVVPVLQQAPLGGQFHISGFKKPEEAKALVDAFTKKKAQVQERSATGETK
jgi:preprotein translocase subunit SecD